MGRCVQGDGGTAGILAVRQMSAARMFSIPTFLLAMHLLVGSDAMASVEATGPITGVGVAFLDRIQPFCAGKSFIWKSPHPWPSRSTKLCEYMKPKSSGLS